MQTFKPWYAVNVFSK